MCSFIFESIVLIIYLCFVIFSQRPQLVCQECQNFLISSKRLHLLNFLQRVSPKFIFVLWPPTNEVWGKVMFLHLFVNLFTGRGLHPAGESACRGRICIHGGVQTSPPQHCRRRSTSARYVSDWKAFLFWTLSGFMCNKRRKFLIMYSE